MAAVMPVVSLAVNIAVLVPVLYDFMGGTQDAAFGPDASARRILICVYAAILVLSAVLLAWPAARTPLLPGLLTVQVAYKILTVPLLGIGHPVAAANLAIAAVHAVTLTAILR